MQDTLLYIYYVRKYEPKAYRQSSMRSSNNYHRRKQSDSRFYRPRRTFKTYRRRYHPYKQPKQKRYLAKKHEYDEPFSIEEMKSVKDGDKTFECLAYALKDNLSEFKETPKTAKLYDSLNIAKSYNQLSGSNIFDSGDLQLTSDIQTMLYQYITVPIKISRNIDKCQINLQPAIKRCESINNIGNCEPVKRIDTSMYSYYAKKCPMNYKRYGCCKCVRGCD